MIPAGVNNGTGVEAFVLDNRVMILRDGEIKPLTDSIQSLHDFYYAMSADHHIETCLNSMGFTGVQAVEKFVSCRFGQFDARADISEDGISMPEFWNCPNRGKCIGEGVVCILPAGVNGKLTPREIQIIKMIYREMTDQQIASELQISVNTVHKHRQNIIIKIDAQSVVGIIKFATQNNIV